MGKFNVDGNAVRDLANILVDTDLTEIEYEDEGRRIRVVRQHPSTVAYAPPPVNFSAHHLGQPNNDNIKSQAPAPVVNPANHPGVVKSPMVGTVYLSPEPGMSAFVKVGDRVEQGQTLLIIEAMKVMNQLKAPHAGVVKEILVKDSSPVEYGESLLIVE